MLIIDDHEPAQQPLSRLLAREGYLADHCCDRSAAFEVLARGEHGVLIAEQHRDLQNGVALVRQVQGAYADVSVILLIADGALDGVLSVLRAGVFDFMTKVFSLSANPEQMLDTLRRAGQRQVGRAALPMNGMSAPSTSSGGIEDVPAESGVRLQVQSLADMELSYIRRVLDVVSGNKASAARLLGVDRTTLYRKLQRQEQLKPAPASGDDPAAHGPRK